MKVSVFRLPSGRLDVLVEASVGNGKSPIVVLDVHREDFVGRVGPVVEAQKGRRKADPGQGGV